MFTRFFFRISRMSYPPSLIPFLPPPFTTEHQLASLASMHEMENRDDTFQSLRGGILADAPGLGPYPLKIIVLFFFVLFCSNSFHYTFMHTFILCQYLSHHLSKSCFLLFSFSPYIVFYCFLLPPFLFDSYYSTSLYFFYSPSSLTHIISLHSIKQK